MSQPSLPAERGGMLPILSDDPPVLKALMLAAGDDTEVREQIRRAYYGVMEGAQFSPSVMHSILLSASYKAIIENRHLPTPSTNGNGVSPGQLKFPTQLDEIEASLKSLPTRDDLQAVQQELAKRSGGEDNKELTAFLDHWRIDEARKSSKKGMLKAWAIYIAGIAAIAAIVFASGYLTCWVIDRSALDAHIVRSAYAKNAADARMSPEPIQPAPLTTKAVPNSTHAH